VSSLKQIIGGGVMLNISTILLVVPPVVNNNELLFIVNPLGLNVVEPTGGQITVLTLVYVNKDITTIIFVVDEATNK
jgi:hypothetical protein